jgi:hypothetical protein
MFKGLVIPKPEEHRQIIMDIHDEIGHFGEGRILVEVKSEYFWHNMTKFVKEVICTCKNCQLVKRTRIVKLEPIELKKFPWDQFFKVALDIFGIFPETKHSIWYVLWLLNITQNGVRRKSLWIMMQKL